MTTRIVGVLLIGLGLARPALGQGIEGRWKLIAAEDLRADGSVVRYPWGRQPVGSIVVQDGSCYVQIMASDVPAFPKGETPTVAQMKAAHSSTYLAYTGPCKTNETDGTFMLTVAAASVPNYPVEQRRFFRVDKDVLYFGPTARVLSEPPWDPASIPAGQLTRRLILQRVTDR